MNARTRSDFNSTLQQNSSRPADATGRALAKKVDRVLGPYRIAKDEPDHWVSALAAEALGEMGPAAEEAVPALVRSLRHIKPLIRANAAEALAGMGAAVVAVLPAIEDAALHDGDGGVRSHALRALGQVAPEVGRNRRRFQKCSWHVCDAHDVVPSVAATPDE